MRVLLLGLLIAAAASCGDDDDDNAGRDAGRSDAGALSDAAKPRDDGAVPAHDAQVRDADPGDADDAGMCEDVEHGFHPFGSDIRGERISLEAFCKRTVCPANWSDALAQAEDDKDAGFQDCYVTVTGCGVDTLIASAVIHGVQWNFDHASGALIGASNVFSDIQEGPCGISEYHAGRDRSDCASEETHALPHQSQCAGSDEDAGR
jgi:hypothetical protein